MAKVKIEGQIIEVNDEIAKNNDLLRETLSSHYPSAREGKIERNGNQITITRQAGTKG
jgi:hypothetical protein